MRSFVLEASATASRAAAASRAPPRLRAPAPRPPAPRAHGRGLGRRRSCRLGSDGRAERREKSRASAESVRFGAVGAGVVAASASLDDEPPADQTVAPRARRRSSGLLLGDAAESGAGGRSPRPRPGPRPPRARPCARSRRAPPDARRRSSSARSCARRFASSSGEASAPHESTSFKTSSVSLGGVSASSETVRGSGGGGASTGSRKDTRRCCCVCWRRRRRDRHGVGGGAAARRASRRASAASPGGASRRSPGPPGRPSGRWTGSAARTSSARASSRRARRPWPARAAGS